VLATVAGESEVCGMSDYTVCFDLDWILIPLCFLGGIVTPLIIILVIQHYKRKHR
jgi:hypothetical protein